MRRLAVALVVAAVAAGGCGLPDENEPRRISADDLESLTPSTAPASQGDVAIDVYYRNTATGQLTERERMVDEVTPETRLEALFEPLSAENDPPFLESAIPAGTLVNGVNLDDFGVLTIDLGATQGDVLPLQGEAELLAFAQMVFTVSKDPRVTGVRFLLNGAAVDAPVETDPGSKAIVTVDDYPQLAPA